MAVKECNRDKKLTPTPLSLPPKKTISDSYQISSLYSSICKEVKRETVHFRAKRRKSNRNFPLCDKFKRLIFELMVKLFILPQLIGKKNNFCDFCLTKILPRIWEQLNIEPKFIPTHVYLIRKQREPIG